MKRTELMLLNQQHDVPRFNLGGYGYGYKSNLRWEDIDDDEIVYIPEDAYHFDEEWGLPNRYLNNLEDAFSKADLIQLCNGDSEIAKQVFLKADYQYPSEVLEQIQLPTETMIHISDDDYTPDAVWIRLVFSLDEQFDSVHCPIEQLAETIHQLQDANCNIINAIYVTEFNEPI